MTQPDHRTVWDSAVYHPVWGEGKFIKLLAIPPSGPTPTFRYKALVKFERFPEPIWVNIEQMMEAIAVEKRREMIAEDIGYNCHTRTERTRFADWYYSKYRSYPMFDQHYTKELWAAWEAATNGK